MTTGWFAGRVGPDDDATAPLRVGVLGAGRIGRLHCELLARDVAGATVTVVADTRRDAARRLAARIGARATTDAAEVVASPDVDAVAVCTSTESHADAIVAIAEAGKAVFCEKPVSLRLSEVDRALAAVERAGVPFMAGFNRRFDPGHASVRQAVEDGTVGSVHLVRITSRDPEPPPREYLASSGGIFLDMTIHDFDMARFVVGAEIVEVTAFGAVRVDPVIGAAGDVDTAVTVLTHADGTITTIDNSRRAVYGYDQRVEVFGDRGVARSENPVQHAGWSCTAERTTGPVLPWFFLDRYLASYRAEWERFVAYLQSGGASPVDAASARAPIVAALAAGRSLRERRPVCVSEVG